MNTFSGLETLCGDDDDDRRTYASISLFFLLSLRLRMFALSSRVKQSYVQ